MPVTRLEEMQMSQLLRCHDLVYERPPAEWIEGIPIANGEIGAVMWGDGTPWIFSLDSYGVWETRTPWPGDDPRFNYANLRRLKEEGRREELLDVALRRRNMTFDVTGNTNPPLFPTRLSLGRMELRWPKPSVAFSARLDLFHACTAGTMEFPLGRARFSSFICSTRDVLVCEIRCENKMPLPKVSLVPAPADDFCKVHFDAWKYPPIELSQEGNRHILFRRYSEGKEYSIIAEEWHARGELTIFLTIAAGKEGDQTRARAIQQLTEARLLGVSALRKEHETDWERFWSKSAILLPDSRLENLYYVEMYKHYCSSRPGHLPVPLQGVWTTDGGWPPWRGNYTTDLNVQLSYWPIYTSNHLESGEPLYEMYWRNLPYHKKIGSYWYGKEIAVITGEHGPGGEPYPGYFTTDHCSPGGGAWIAHMFWLHWLYSQDRKFLLRRTYPFLREMVQAYLHIAEKRPDGKYHIAFADSPEFYCGQPESMGDDPNYDLAFLRFLLASLLESQKHLPQPDPQSDLWKELQESLVDYPVAPTGLFQYESMDDALRRASDASEHMCLALRAGEPLPHTHRHLSHLIGIYPLGEIDPERSPAERKLVENSLEDLVFKGTGEWCGFTFPWASMIAGRAGKARMAHSYLQRYLEAFIASNSFHINYDCWQKGISAYTMKAAAVTLEAGFAAAAAILEMLLQSHHGQIRVFPTCPPVWRDAQFVNLRAEGAFLVSAKMEDGKVRFVEITSEAGGNCCVRNPFAAPCLLMEQSSGENRTLEGEILEFTTRRGGHYQLLDARAVAKKDEMTFSIPSRPANQRNWFGLQSVVRF